MNIRSAIIIAFIAVSASAIPSSGLSDLDKSVLKLTAIMVLDDTGNFNYVNADVGWDDSLNIWFISKRTDQESLLIDLASIVGVYWGACKNHPNLSNLNLYVGTEDNVAGSLYCERSWLNQVRTDSEGNMDDTDAGILVLKVLGTFEER